MKTTLAGKVALVAGATRGAGRGIAVQVDHLVPDQDAGKPANLTGYR